MTDQERARQLAEKIGSGDLTIGFAGNPLVIHELGDPDLIVTALRAYSGHGNAPSNEGNGAASPCSADLRETVARAMFCLVYRRELWERADCRDRFIASANAALSSISAAGYDLVKRGHWVAYQPDQPGTHMIRAALATKEHA